MSFPPSVSFRLLPALALACALCLVPVRPAVALQVASPPAPSQTASADALPQRLVLALDGIPYELFAELQQQGHFTDFRPAARMVAPFPSLSDVSFAAIGGSAPPAGYQVMRFDPTLNKVVGNTLFSLSSQAHPNIPADSSEHSSWHRMIGYVAAYHVAIFDMHRIGEEVLASHKPIFVAYLEQSDAVMHVEGRDGGTRFLLELDRFLQQLQAEVRARSGRSLMVDIVSDHGSTMERGRNVPLEAALRDCGYARRKRIEADDQVAYSYAGIIGSVAITARPTQVDTVAHCLAPLEGVDLVAVDHGDHVLVLAADGAAEVRPAAGDEEAYLYRPLRGDPLGLAGGATGEQRFVEAELFRATVDAPRPDPLRRLWRAFHGAVAQPTPILVSLQDGREAGNETVRALAQLRGRAGTHGSMTRRASLGVIASNWQDVSDVDAWRAHTRLFGRDTELAASAVAQSWTATAATSTAAATTAGAPVAVPAATPLAPDNDHDAPIHAGAMPSIQP